MYTHILHECKPQITYDRSEGPLGKKLCWNLQTYNPIINALAREGKSGEPSRNRVADLLPNESSYTFFSLWSLSELYELVWVEHDVFDWWEKASSSTIWSNGPF